MSGRKNQGSRDYVAVAVFIADVAVFIVSGSCLVRTIKRQGFDNAVKIVSR